VFDNASHIGSWGLNGGYISNDGALGGGRLPPLFNITFADTIIRLRLVCLFSAAVLKERQKTQNVCLYRHLASSDEIKCVLSPNSHTFYYTVLSGVVAVAC
jgi:hypothetical protein